MDAGKLPAFDQLRLVLSMAFGVLPSALFIHLFILAFFGKCGIIKAVLTVTTMLEC